SRHRRTLDELRPELALAAGDLDGVAATLELGLEAVSNIAMHFDEVAAERTAGAARALQLASESSKRGLRAAEARNEGDRLAAAALAVAQQTDDAVARQIQRLRRFLPGRATLSAGTPIDPLAASRTPPRLHGV